MENANQFNTNWLFASTLCNLRWLDLHLHCFLSTVLCVKVHADVYRCSTVFAGFVHLISTALPSVVNMKSKLKWKSFSRYRIWNHCAFTHTLLMHVMSDEKAQTDRAIENSISPSSWHTFSLSCSNCSNNIFRCSTLYCWEGCHHWSVQERKS